MVIKKKPAVKAKAGCKRKPVRSDSYLEIKKPTPRCPTCVNPVEFINLYYKAHPKMEKGRLDEVVINSKTFCPKCGGIPKRASVRSDSVGRLEKTYLVTLRWELAGTHSLTRKIAENAPTGLDARRKVMAYYTTSMMVSRLGRPRVISVKRALKGGYIPRGNRRKQ